MVWKRIRKRLTADDERRIQAPADTPAPAIPEPRTLPPHLANRVRSPDRTEPAAGDRERRLHALERRRAAMLYDVRQGEQAEAEDNPWTQRMALLTEALGTIGEDRGRLDAAPKSPFHPVPPTPISIERVEIGDVAEVAFRVGNERFTYSEDPDWAERGHQITRTDLVLRSGDPQHLVPADTPDELRQELERHLTDSLFVLATDLRDRLLEGEPLPQGITLADLARPCPTCGGWTDWRGTCQACAQRSARLAELKREETRLLDARAAEAEERHRLIEGLPVARRRLHDVEIEIAALTDES